MASEIKIVKLALRSKRLPSCSLTIAYFQRLFDLLQSISKEAAEYEIGQNIKRESYESEDEFEKAKKECLDLYKITVNIRGSQNELFSSQDKSIFDENNLPNFITYISFDSVSMYRYFLNKEPLNSIKVYFDFSKPLIFDFLGNPSRATLNTSIVQVSGEYETWVQGSYERVLSTLEGMTTKRAWLHKNNIYDSLLWLLIVPLTFFYLYKLQLIFSKNFESLPSVFAVAIYIYIFLIILSLSVILFKYARWAFPYMEVETSIKSKATIHRRVFWSIISAIFAGTLAHIIIGCLRHIVP